MSTEWPAAKRTMFLRLGLLAWCLLLPVVTIASGAAWGQSAPQPRVPSGTKLVVADQNEVLQTLMRASGAQRNISSTVMYANFLGGPAILEAFRSLKVEYVISSPGSEWPSFWEAMAYAASAFPSPIVSSRRMSSGRNSVSSICFSSLISASNSGDCVRVFNFSKTA